MNQTKSHQGITYPQTVEIPEPLEIHPSVDPELARGLIAAVEYIEDHPAQFDIGRCVFVDGKGCICCHAERLSSWQRPCSPKSDEFLSAQSLDDIPIGHWERVYWYMYWPKQFDYRTAEGRVNRVNHFLRTGE